MPFPGAIDSLSNGTLLFSAIAAFFSLLAQGRAPSWRHTAATAGAILLLALLATMEGGPLLLILALSLCAAAAAFLAQAGEGPFRAGLASLLAGHLAYAALFAVTGGGMEILAAQPWRAALPALGILAATLLLLRPPAPRLPLAAGIAAMLAMVFAAATVPAPLVLIGATLLLAADALLAAERFLLAGNSPHRAWAGPAAWILSYLAQLSITLGFLL